jgi:hypothetical protein
MASYIVTRTLFTFIRPLVLMFYFWTTTCLVLREGFAQMPALPVCRLC